MSPKPTDSPEISTRNLHGHALRRVQKLNNTLQRTRTLVAEAHEDPQQSIALLLAETRVLVLQMGRHEFGAAAGMHFHAVKNVETPGGHPQHESFSRVYRAWQMLANGQHEHSSRVRSQLNRSSAKLLDLLVPEHDDRGRPQRSTVDGLYRLWIYQCGQQAFEEASRKTSPQRVPLTYGTLWQRREVGMVPDFDEVRVIGTHLGLDLAEGTTIWKQCKDEQLQKRGVPAALARFIVAIQVAYEGLKMSARSLRRHLKVNERTAQAITNGQLIRYDEIRHVVVELMSKKEATSLHNDWQATWDVANSHEDFATAFPRICTSNGWTNHMLATLLQVRPPEQRVASSVDKSKSTQKSHRSEVYRPSAEIRRMYQENSFASQAPAKAAIDLITGDQQRPSGAESERDYLTRLFLEGVERRLQQKGSGAQGSPIRAHRMLCGVTPEQLAEVSGYSRADILLIERGIQRLNSAETSQLVRLIETFPAQKVREARLRLTELSSSPVSVPQAVARLKDRNGGYIPLSRLLHDDTDRHYSFTPGRLKRMERGLDVPALPLLKYLVTRGGDEMTPELLRDWYERIPSYLAGHGKLQWTHPLARGLGVVIFEKWHNLYQFWEEQLRDDLSYSMLTRNIQQFNGRGHDFPWATVSRYLNAAGVGISDPRRFYLQVVFEQKTELSNAIQDRNRTALPSLMKNVLQQWRKTFRSTQGDPTSMEHTLGLLPEERSLKAK